jgi:hypothetical protein
MSENRFAILIGMDRYDESPLDFSVKDATDLKEALIKYCKFGEENIKLIVDSQTPVKEQIDSAFKNIAEKFKSKNDLFLFYFSGHGEYDEKREKSYIVFEDDSTLFVGDIVTNYFGLLKAKNEYLIIDACHSGKSFHIKPKHNKRKTERILLNNSADTYFLFAAEENKKAYQNNKLKNSYYTYYFLEAVKNNKLYDENGWLTMNAIDEYIRRKLTTLKNVIQIPGSESRGIGYKPFAFLEDEKNATLQTSQNNIEIMENSSNGFDLEQSLSEENRKLIQNQLSDILEGVILNYNLNDFEADYEIEKSGGSYLPSELERSLEERIILRAQQEDLDAIHGVFHKEIIEQKRKKTGISGMMNMMLGEPEPQVYYTIRHYDNVVRSKFILFKAKKFDRVSGGLYVMFYQSKYGFVFCRAYFKYDWDGTNEKVANFIKVELLPYTLEASSLEAVKSELNNSFTELVKLIKKWNEERKAEISKFLSRVKK